MWRNTVMTDFVAWLREWNLKQPADDRVGLFGMDLYSMHASIDSVLGYLDKVDPEAARRARIRYSCFDSFGEDPQVYGYAATRGGQESCENPVVAQLFELRRQYGELISRDGRIARDEFFYAEQNARLVANAERYYRSMFRGRELSWNLRDEHMADTLDALAFHFGGSSCKMIVWAHNSHLGDARATEMGARGEWNVGQLMRERHGREVCSIGFTTSSGTVTAARDWGAPHERRKVRQPLAGSCEAHFHAVGFPAFWLDLRTKNDASELLRSELLQRAIGVIYRPETERPSHYFSTRLAQQFDLVIHIDETTALEPLERTSRWDRDELPETYPEGF
jgi:erythromycin esterase-like protein